MTVWPSGGFGFRGEAFGFLGEAFGFLGEAFGFIGEAFGFLGEAFGFIGVAVLLRRKLRAERRLAIDGLGAQFGDCSGTAAAVRSIVGKRVGRQKINAVRYTPSYSTGSQRACIAHGVPDVL